MIVKAFHLWDKPDLECRLGFALIELKMAYYYIGSVHKSWCPYVIQPDSFYDRLEDLYRRLNPCELVCDMVGFDRDYVESTIVWFKLTAPREDKVALLESFL